MSEFEHVDLSALAQPIDCVMPCANPDYTGLHCVAKVCRFGPIPLGDGRLDPVQSGRKEQS